MNSHEDVWYNAVDDEFFLIGNRDYQVHDFLETMERMFGLLKLPFPVTYVGTL